ncbi:hypothetical protein [Streptomyces sp. NPDC053079]|uniref:hypothetical protein n=1 Tax=Streptomyces sp. NPDC053079 TaxID=3365697 RepID=UPI0037CFBB79
MTVRWPPAELPGLHVDMGHWNYSSGEWLRIPTADYRCRCGWTASASGDGVPSISKAIAAHECTTE